MKKAELLAMVERGEFLAFGEYRSTSCDVVTWRDKGSGKAVSSVFVKHVVEFGDKSVTVGERAPEGIEATKDAAEKLKAVFAGQFKKGNRVAVAVSRMITEKGHVSMDGKLTVVE